MESTGGATDGERPTPPGVSYGEDRRDREGFGPALPLTTVITPENDQDGPADVYAGSAVRRVALKAEEPPAPRSVRFDLPRFGARNAAIVGCLAVLGALGFLIAELRPDLLFGSGVDVGGDNGGHIAAPYFLIHDLLPHGRLTGWDPWWFEGFPLYVFYFPLPALMIALGSVVLPYAVAFKLVTVLGTVTLPLAAYAFGRLSGFRRPVPVLMATAMLPFLFNTSYTIDGGNIVSTMAGEFSFSLAVSVGLVFLGTVSYALRTGKLRWLAALLFAITCVCHVVPALAFGFTALLMAVMTPRRRSLVRGMKVIVPIGVVGALLAAWWLMPFGSDLQYSSSMNYQPVGGPWPGWFTQNLAPEGYLMILIPAALGTLVAIVARNRPAFVLVVACIFSVVAFHWLPSGLVYNARWLPFWFLFTALLAAYGVGEIFRWAGHHYEAPSWFASQAIVLGIVGAIIGSVFLGGLEGNGFLGFTMPPNHVQVSGWVSFNNAGIQARPGWPVFKNMVSLLDRAGGRYGCGRLQYEYIAETNLPFGSTVAMMSIPMWTNGCMQTTDGIYYESSSSTPFHFLDVSEVSQNGESPDPVAGLAYPGFNLADGVRHLQLTGVRYFLAMSPPVESAANQDADLVRIGSVASFPGPYNSKPVTDPRMVLYVVKNSPLVEPLRYLPEVEPSGKQPWFHANLAWYENERYWDVFLARSGPASWPRAKPGRLVSSSRAVATKARDVTISDVRETAESISFDVSSIGTPLLVKIPYFPNWGASGATGPYEVSPNLMAVVPTSRHVTLTYGTTKVDWAGKAASLLGVVGLGVLISARPSPPAIPTPTTPPEDPFPVPAAPEEETEGDVVDDSSLEGAETAPKVSVVLPAYNEESLIETTVRDLVRALSDSATSYEIVIVENGSTDSTSEIAGRLASSNRAVRLVRLPEPDYGEALRVGFLAARGEIVVNFDVDYYDVGFLNMAISLVSRGDAEIVLASKRAPGSSDRRPLHRKILTAGFTAAMRGLLGVPVTDAHGMKALNRTALSPVVDRTQSYGPLFDVELVARAHRASMGIVELPTEVREVRPARTGVVKRTVDSLVGLLKLRWFMGPGKPV